MAFGSGGTIIFFPLIKLNSGFFSNSLPSIIMHSLGPSCINSRVTGPVPKFFFWAISLGKPFFGWAITFLERV